MTTTYADTTPWPDWLEAHELDDALLAQAYAATPAPQRACLKNGMALHYALWGERATRTTVSRCDGVHGFCVQHSRAPVAWAVCCVTPSYASPARLMAALMPALLAGAPLAAVCVDGLPLPAVCLALELLGISRLYTLDAQHCRALLTALPADGSGRVLLLHNGALADLRAVARAAHAPLWEEDAPPALLVDADSGVDAALLAYAQPDAPRLPSTAVVADARRAHGYLCRYSANAAVARAVPDVAVARAVPDADLTLGTGMEGCWLHAGLTPDFFRRTHVQAATYEEDV